MIYGGNQFKWVVPSMGQNGLEWVNPKTFFHQSVNYDYKRKYYSSHNLYLQQNDLGGCMI